jgi:hypothetical protein
MEGSYMNSISSDNEVSMDRVTVLEGHNCSCAIDIDDFA